ncbi:MAG: LytTR family DNA-binding domain-containing protein [Pseudomonadota bacterium]
MTKQTPNIFVQELIRGSGFTAAAGTLAALAGLYNTHLLGWPGVWLYWVGLIGLGVWIGGAINAQIGPRMAGTPWVVVWLVSSAAVTAPMFGLVAAAQTFIGYPVPASGFLDLAAKVFFVTAAITGIRLMRMQLNPSSISPAVFSSEDEGRQAKQESAAEAATSTTPKTPALAKRLSQKLKGAEIWALSAEDHYVRVHSAAGADLVLMRLADAIEAMDGAEGARVHRSWWIARAGFAGFRRKTEGGVITLKDGSEAPVSRSNIAAFDALNWTGENSAKDAAP